MLDIIDTYISNSGGLEDFDSFDEQKIMLSALKSVFALIIERELTQKQSLCLKMYCVEHMSQRQIAELMKLSQPTVSRHITSAKAIINKYLNYCYYSLKKSNEQWLKVF